jgi:hypothetical protein
MSCIHIFTDAARHPGTLDIRCHTSTYYNDSFTDTAAILSTNVLVSVSYNHIFTDNTALLETKTTAAI